MKKQMRIVGLNSSSIVIQKKDGNNSWNQAKVSNSDFDKMMKEGYPDFYDEYQAATKNGIRLSAAEYFYHYGETDEMIQKGDAFIYR